MEHNLLACWANKRNAQRHIHTRTISFSNDDIIGSHQYTVFQYYIFLFFSRSLSEQSQGLFGYFRIILDHILDRTSHIGLIQQLILRKKQCGVISSPEQFSVPVTESFIYINCLSSLDFQFLTYSSHSPVHCRPGILQAISHRGHEPAPPFHLKYDTEQSDHHTHS